MRITHRLVATAAAMAITVVVTGSPARPEEPARHSRMDSIFTALSSALNLTLYDTPFESDETRTMITQALGVLAHNAAELQAHAGEPTHPNEHLRRSLARDATEALLRYRQERFEGARFLLGQLTSSCVACHSKLPRTVEFDLGREFIERARIEDIPARQLARLMVATRQFERALEVYEDLFRSEDARPHELASSGALTEYLEVSLRVMEDGDRAARTLRSLARRSDVTGFMESQLTAWIEVISGFQFDHTDMATARTLIHQARQRNAFPRDRHGMAHFVLAAGCLYRHLAANPDTPDRAEVCYLLGICEAHTAASPWVSEAEFFLESAVHTDPTSRFAALAVDFLQAYLSEQYRGSAGIVIPEDAQAHIDSLRSLVSPRE